MNSDDSTAQAAQREIMLSLCNIRFQLIRMNALLICQMQFLAFVLLARRHWTNKKGERKTEELEKLEEEREQSAFFKKHKKNNPD